MTPPSPITDEVHATLVRAVARVCPVWMRDQREDLVQMAAVKLLRSTQQGTLTQAYLWRVAYSVVIDEIRRRRRRNEVGMSPSINARIVNSAELSPETLARGSEIGENLVSCLAELSEERKKAVALYLQDHTVPEIAQILGWNRKKASNAVYRGLEDLRAQARARGVVP